MLTLEFRVAREELNMLVLLPVLLGKTFRRMKARFESGELLAGELRSLANDFAVNPKERPFLSANEFERFVVETGPESLQIDRHSSLSKSNNEGVFSAEGLFFCPPFSPQLQIGPARIDAVSGTIGQRVLRVDNDIAAVGTVVLHRSGKVG